MADLHKTNGGLIGVDYTETFDLYHNFSVLKLRCDGANGSTTFTDLSPSGQVVTANGNAQVSTAQSKFYGSSLYLDGAGDYLQTGGITNPTSVWTMSAWVYWNSAATYEPLITCRTGSNEWFLYIGNGVNGHYGPYWTNNGSTTASTNPANAPPISTWFHVEASHDGTTLRMFLDGVLVVSAARTDDITNSTHVQIGSSVRNQEYMYGHLQDVQIYEGVALHTSSFTPPTRPLQPRRYSGVHTLGGQSYSNMVLGVDVPIKETETI